MALTRLIKQRALAYDGDVLDRTGVDDAASGAVAGSLPSSRDTAPAIVTAIANALASDARGASSDSDDAFLESLCRAPKARRSCPVAALGGTGGASSDDEFVGGLCKAPRNQAFVAALPSPAAASRAADAADTLSLPREFADFPPRVATQPLARARGRSLNPQRRETCELGHLTPRPLVEDDWGHGQLAARMQAQIVELTDCFRDQIATQDLPITLHLSTSTVGCEDALRSIVVDVLTAWQFYVGVTVDPVRRWLGDANPSRWLGEGGDDGAAARGPMPGHHLAYGLMHLLAVAPRYITRWLEPHLIKVGKRASSSRSRNIAEDARGQADGLNFVYVCVLGVGLCSIHAER